MSNDLNSCSFIGRLAADPESKFLPSGDQVTNFRIAVGWKTKEKEGCEWINCVAFSKLAEICGKYLVKGKQVFVNGRFKTRTWEKDGQKHYATEIAVNDMQMLGSKSDGSGSGNSGGDGGGNDGNTYRPPALEEDIPF
jgi:single-strand DNA-binding protein